MKNINILICLVVILVFYSCKKKDSNNNERITQKELKPKIELLFPDTIYVSKPYNGIIEYEGNELDTLNIMIDDDLEDNGKARYVFYSLIKTRSLSEKVDFKNKVVDTFISKTNTEISIQKLKFDELGVNYIDGILTDEAYLKLENDKIRIITKEYRITKEVIVVDSTVVIGAQTKLPVKGNI